MPVLRTQIESALDEIISQEEGMRFQGLAVVLGKQRWPELIAHQRKSVNGGARRDHRGGVRRDRLAAAGLSP